MDVFTYSADYDELHDLQVSSLHHLGFRHFILFFFLFFLFIVFFYCVLLYELYVR